MSPPNDEDVAERSPYQRATDDTLKTLHRRQQTLSDRVEDLDARINRLETLVTALVHEVADTHDRTIDDVLADLADETDLPTTDEATSPQAETSNDDDDPHTRYV